MRGPTPVIVYFVTQMQLKAFLLISAVFLLAAPTRSHASLLSLAACNSDTSSAQEESQRTELSWTHPADTLDESFLPTQEQVGSTLREIGYSKFEFIGKSVVVDGDMVLHRSDFLPSPYSETPALGKVAQRVVDRWMGNSVSRHVTWRIYIHPGLPYFWRVAATNAISTWAEVGPFKFRITKNLFDADMRILPSFILGPRIGAVASFPRVLKYGPIPGPNGIIMQGPTLVAPGNMIQINAKEGKKSDLSYTLVTMIHEFGHTFGFTHTDGPEGVHVPGTLEFDPYSVMNTYAIDHYRGFSKNDIKAIRYMYPLLTNRESSK